VRIIRRAIGVVLVVGHYNDQIGPWLDGDTVPLPFTPAAVAAAASSTLILTP